jgi:hypothetical protein
MNDTQWDDQLKTFLKKTGDELKRAGEEIKKEGERLLVEVRDPEKHKKVKDGLKEFGTWAKKTAEEVAVMVEQGVKKAEVAVRGVGDKQAAPATAEDDEASTAPTPPSPPPYMPPAGKAKKATSKTIGRGKGSKPASGGAKKTIGRKR